MSEHYLSILITGGTVEDRLDQIEGLANASKFQTVSFDCREKKTLAEVREIITTTLYKPSYEAKASLNLIEIQNLSIDAQTTLLKLVEEPPRGYEIHLTADHKESVLATITSRCRLIDLGNSELNQEDSFFHNNLETQIERIDEVDFDQIIRFLEKKLRGTQNKPILELLTTALETKKSAQTNNLNKKLAKERLLLGLNKISKD